MNVKPGYIIFDKTNWDIADKKSNYRTLISTNEHKDMLEKDKKIWNETKYLIKVKCDNSDGNDDKSMKISFT